MGRMLLEHTRHIGILSLIEAHHAVQVSDLRLLLYKKGEKI